MAASAAVPGFRKFGAPLELEEGTLEARGEDFDGCYSLQFRFTPKPGLLKRPYTLEVRFTTGDKARHTLYLRNTGEDAQGVIYSDPDDGRDIDYTRGIIIDEEKDVIFKFDGEV
jgi:hypothetical protein